MTWHSPPSVSPFLFPFSFFPRQVFFLNPRAFFFFEKKKGARNIRLSTFNRSKALTSNAYLFAPICAEPFHSSPNLPRQVWNSGNIIWSSVSAGCRFCFQQQTLACDGLMLILAAPARFHTFTATICVIVRCCGWAELPHPRRNYIPLGWREIVGCPLGGSCLNRSP